MTYDQEAAAFNWKRWDAYRAMQAEGKSVGTIAARFGKTPCDVRRLLENGARLEAWRPKA